MSTTTRLSELLLRWQELKREGQDLAAEELCADCPELIEDLRQQMQALESMESLLGMRTRHGDPASPADARFASTQMPGELPQPGDQRAADRWLVPGYEVLGVLDQGGMGIVYKARQTALKRLVALKVILAGPYARADQVERFRREAEALANLQHPNIVQIHEVGESSGNRPYFSMEFVEGGNLAHKLAERLLPAREAAGLALTLARAVHYAHQRGVLHRDLKPANVLLTRDGVPKITDFGLAKLLGHDAETGEPSYRTQSGAVMGTASYMAPEQATGKTHETGPAVDVYALGAILYEMLTGRPPFQGETTLDTLEQVRTQDPVPPSRLQPRLPRDLETITLKCLDKEPAKRYPSAEALADELQRFLAGEPIRARPIAAWRQAVKWARRKPAQAVLIAVSVAAALCLLAVWGWFTAQLHEERNKAIDQARIARIAQQQALRETEIAESKKAEARRERDEARKQRTRARAILRRALAEVDEHARSTENSKTDPVKRANPGSVLYNLANVYALASATTRRDTDLSTDDRNQLAEHYAARCVELLEKADTIGFFGNRANLDRLAKDRDLDPVRSREDFKRLLKEVQKKARAASSHL
ncbi:MAG TPA: protein kinase [Gemmataceae bacterium]|jgi:serine/threonine-protein kinase|nr:protein kinase [Gemmataceae bacterium]